MFQSLLVSLVADQTLQDFPKRLPSSLREQYRIAIHATNEYLEKTWQNNEGLNEIDFKTTDDNATLFSQATVGIIFESSMAVVRERREEIPKIASFFDCDRVIQAQQLVMLFAQIDAFLALTVRAICIAKPDVLKKERKQISWQRVMEANSIDELKGELIEHFIYDMGREGELTLRLESLRQQFGLTLDTSRAHVPDIQLLERVRDITVHNGGRVSQQFIKRTGQKVPVGGSYPVKDSDVLKLFLFAKRLCGSLYVEVSKKFFDKQDTQITGVMHQL
jgi:hypothetical protein